MLEFYDAVGVKRLGYLSGEEVKDLCRVDSINGMITLKFNCFVTQKTVRLIETENRIKFEDEEYIIKSPSATLNDEGVIKISCVSSAEELMYRYIDGQLAFANLSISYAVSRVLENTGWTLFYCDPTITALRDVNLEYMNRLEALNELLKLYGAVDEYLYGPFVRFDTINKTVSIYNEVGSDNGVTIQSGRNLSSLELTHDSKSLVTRLYVKGQDGADITSINNGIAYIENFSYFKALGYNTADSGIRERLVREDIVNYDKISEPSDLYSQGEKKLASIAWPKVNVNIDLVDLYKLYDNSLYKINIGDWVTVIYNAPQDIEIKMKVRVIEMTQYPYESNKNSIEVGTPRPQLTDTVKPAITTSRIVTRNRQVNSLLQGFINTATTLINGTRGLLTITDNTIDFWGIDADGRRNGNGVRLSPGGLGITDNGGQSYKTAVTGEGVLSSTIVINELYALSTADEYTKIQSDGLHIYDQNNTERLHAGHWLVENDMRFGLKITSSDGSTVILDDRGMLQTWQIQASDNLDYEHPLKIIFYVPQTANLQNGKRFLLSFTREWFRAYEKSASDGGSTVQTSAPGIWTLIPNQYLLPDFMNLSGNHLHDTTMDSGGTHNHGIEHGTTLLKTICKLLYKLVML